MGPVDSGVKFLLFLYCFGIRRSSSQVQILWEDHRNDLWINTFGKRSIRLFFPFRSSHISISGILMSAGGSRLKWCMLYLFVTIFKKNLDNNNIRLYYRFGSHGRDDCMSTHIPVYSASS